MILFLEMINSLIYESSDEDELAVVPRRRRVFNRRIEYLNANEFRERFRLMPWQAELLLNTIGSDIEPRDKKRTSMSAKHKLMAALRFYAANTFYYTIGDAQGKLQ